MIYTPKFVFLSAYETKVDKVIKYFFDLEAAFIMRINNINIV